MTESFQYVTDEMNGHSQEVPKLLGYIWGQKSKFAYLNRTMCCTTFASPTVLEVFRYEGLVTRAYGAIVELT